MQRVDLIEKRRFVGRELLLLLWMESELFEGTLATREHGSFGLWIEKRLQLSAEGESTRIVGATPGLGREAKEALLRGQLPESAGIRIAWKDDETSLVLTGESLGVRALRLQTQLGAEEESFVGDAVDELAGRSARARRKKKGAPEQEGDEDSAFYERMQKTREIEGLLAALYRDFLALRLSRRWDAVVVPTLRRWAEGAKVDADAYRAARDGRKLGPAAKPTPAKGTATGRRARR